MQPYLSSPCQVSEATRLIERFGDGAIEEARRRAGQSRDLGNLVRFCRWRQIERLLVVLGDDPARNTLH